MNAKLKPGESVFIYNGPMLAVKWCDKKAVTVISTIHKETDAVIKKRHAAKMSSNLKQFLHTLIS